ncbi:MAG: phospholipid-binding protein [Coxiellaceae bacterium]|nr:phospholipid-binding protein [Coxiellaceae bacterium]|tara:strand:- start:3823 stop:4401 length:579 start_codon:yes stop_codon:yes gene_type:complete
MRHLTAILLSLITGIMITACVPTAVVVGAATTSSVVYDKRDIKTVLNDRKTTQTAVNLIKADSELKGRSNIHIATFNHVLLLVGQAQTPELKTRAYQIVSSVKGISRIYNEITVSGATSSLQHTNDTWLTTKVKTALIAKAGLKSNQFKVVTENNVVYLMGLTGHEQGDEITNIARHVEGVTKVVTVFQYIT